MKVIVSNHSQPIYGQVTVPLPIPDEEYDHIIELLENLEIGDFRAWDCHVDEISDCRVSTASARRVRRIFTGADPSPQMPIPSLTQIWRGTIWKTASPPMTYLNYKTPLYGRRLFIGGNNVFYLE